MVVLFLLVVQLVSVLLADLSHNLLGKLGPFGNVFSLLEHTLFQKIFDFDVVLHLGELVDRHSVVLVHHKHIDRLRRQRGQVQVARPPSFPLFTLNFDLDDARELSVEKRQFIVKVIDLNLVLLLLCFDL